MVPKQTQHLGVTPEKRLDKKINREYIIPAFPPFARAIKKALRGFIGKRRKIRKGEVNGIIAGDRVDQGFWGASGIGSY
jgi:hypothetical protein